jgi:hypothetical protein
MELYGPGDHSDDAWDHIESYAKGPLATIVKAVGRVGDILACCWRRYR